MSWTPGPNPCVPVAIRHLCSKYITWPFASMCNHGCPYCFVGARPGVAIPRAWTDAQAVAAWQAVADDYGPAYVVMTGAEPTEELPLMAAVIQHHYACVQTNLGCDIDELCRLIPADRVWLHPTFHPIAWHLDPEPFLTRVRTLKARGYAFELVALVGYPAYMDRLDEYVAALRTEVGFVNVAPARSTTYHGRKLPEEYTPEELAILNRHIPTATYNAQAMTKPLRVVACAAGVDAATVSHDGTVRRCSQVAGGMGQQNMMQSGRLVFNDEPLPCGEAQCYCANMYPYHITEA